MRVIRGYSDLGLEPGSPAVTIGNFDGVHLGHRKVMLSAVTAARSRGVAAIGCTFDPHTRHVLQPGQAPPLLQTLEQRVRSMEALGIDVVVVMPFDLTVARTPHERFVDELLVAELNVGSLHVSEGFHFGRDQAGSTAYLEQRASDCGFEVVRVAPVTLAGSLVSSTRIREHLGSGDVTAAARLLGRPFSVIGDVIRGAGRGEGLGAPTANLMVHNGCLPAPGVYATEAEVGGESVASVTNIGRRPTFESSGELTVETHLLDYDGPDLYGQPLELAFCERLRDEVRFDSADALRRQIAADVRSARLLLKEWRPTRDDGREPAST